jgi:hypothetical protein
VKSVTVLEDGSKAEIFMPVDSNNEKIRTDVCNTSIGTPVQRLGLNNSSVISVGATGPRGLRLVKYGVLLYLLIEGDIAAAAFAQMRLMRSREGIPQRLRTSIFLAWMPAPLPTVNTTGYT